MLSPNLAIILGHHCSFQGRFHHSSSELASDFAGFLKLVKFLVKTIQSKNLNFVVFQSGFPYRKQSEIPQNLDYLGKTIRKNKQWLWNENRNNNWSIILKINISKPGGLGLAVSTFTEF